MGAIDIRGVWRTTAPPDDVWEVVSDLTTWPQWWPAIREVHTVAGPDHSPSRARMTFDTPPPLRPLHVTFEVVEREEPERLLVRASDGPLSGRAEMRLSAEHGGTAAAYDLHLRVRSLLFRPVERVLAGAARSGGSDRLRRAGDDLARLAGGEPREHDT